MHLIIGHQSENFAYKVTKVFLRCGGDPNTRSTDGVTPTHVAAGWGRNRILHLLLINGGDPWVQDDEKKNAFNYAFEEQEWKTIKMLHHFQQMHLSTTLSSKQTLNFDKLFNSGKEFNFQKILSNKENELSVYDTLKISTKSAMTQTKNNKSDSPSPIQDKIKYFEPTVNTSCMEINCWRKPEKLEMGWTKNNHNASCELFIDGSLNEGSKNTISDKQTFISTIHIETSPSNSSDQNPEKVSNNVDPTDVRGQLLIELQEAVRRRSRLRISEENSGGQNEVNTLNKQSINNSNVLKNNQMILGHLIKKKKKFEMCKLNSVNKSMLKSMSDYATHVMKENEGEKSLCNDTIDLSASNSELTNNYNTQESDSNVEDTNLQNIQTLTLPQNNSDDSTLYLTPYDSNLSTELTNQNPNNDSIVSFFSIPEERKEIINNDEVVIEVHEEKDFTPVIRYNNLLEL